MRDETVTGFLASSRQVSASVTAKKIRPQYTRTVVAENLPLIDPTVVRYDAKYIAGLGFVRALLAYAAALPSVLSVYVCLMTTPTETPVWIYVTAFEHTLAKAADLDSMLADICVLYDGTVVYSDNKQLYQVPPPWTTFVANEGTTGAFGAGWGESLAGLRTTNNITRIGYRYASTPPIEGYPSDLESAGYPIWCNIPYIKGETTMGTHFPKMTQWCRAAIVDDLDPGRWNRNGYLFVESKADKRIYFSFFKSASLTSAHFFPHQPLVPLDSADDEDQMALLGANYVAATSGPIPVVIADVKRKFGKNLLCLLFGPSLDNVNVAHAFSWDRQMIVDESHGDRFANLWTDPTFSYLIGWGFRYEITAFDRTLYEPTPTTFEGVAQLNGSFTVNSPNTMTIDATALPEGVDAGDEVTVKVSANGDLVTLGTYGIDNIQTPNGPDGGKAIVNMSSTAMKRLAQWTSDTSFEIFSQAKSSGRIGDLTKVVRSVGQVEVKEDDPDGTTVRPRNLNEDCILYSTDQADFGGFMRGRFKIKNGSPYTARFGLGLCYHEETLAEAASRLNKKVEETQADECAKVGYFAVVYAVAGVNAAALKIFAYDSMRKDLTLTENPWWELATVSFTMSENVWHDIYFKGSEGYFVAGVKAESTADWSTGPQLELDVNALGTSVPFSDREFYGRGAIYLRTNTMTRKAYAFSTESTAIGLVPETIEDPIQSLANKTVRIDSEDITFAAGKDVMPAAGLFWSPGKVSAAYTPPGVAEQPLSQTRANSYVRQVFTMVSSPLYCKAVTIWLKKYGYPEDGVQVSLVRGPTSASSPLGSVLTTSTLSSADISPAGSYVTFYFYGTVSVQNGDWIMISRLKNPHHPNSSNYYSVLLQDGYAGGNFATFSEDTDAWTNSAVGEMCFQMYTTIDPPGGMYTIPVWWSAELSGVADYYVDAALCATEGEGAGASYRITKYTPLAGENLAVFYVDREPVFSFGSNTKFAVASSLHTLVHGANSTVPMSHAEGSKVDLLEDVERLQAANFANFSNGFDHPLQDVVEHVCRKAGVHKFRLNNLGRTVTSATPLVVQSLSNAILDIIPSSSVFKFTLRFRGDGNGANHQFSVEFESANRGPWTHYELLVIRGPHHAGKMDAGDMISGYKIGLPPIIRVSLQGEFLSVWTEGHMVYGSYLDPAIYPYDPSLTSLKAEVDAVVNNPVTVYIPEVNQLQDYYCIDLGKRALDALVELVGNKRVWFREGSKGTIDIFSKRTIVNPAPADYAVTYTKTISDNVATRLLVEGAETVEVQDMDLVRRLGNLFAVKSVPEAYTVWDGTRYGNQLLTEEKYAQERAQFSAAVDPRIEVGDTVLVAAPDGNKEVIVDSMSFSMSVAPDNAVMDMEAQGRVKA